jgi:hypothetical protein
MTKNVKLTNHARDQIISNALRGAFEKEYADIKKRLAKIAMDCYRSVVPAAKEKAARQAPEEFLSLTNSLTLRFYDVDTKSHLKTERSVEVAKPLPFFSRESLGYLSVYDRDVYLAYRTLDDERAALDKKRGELAESIRLTVYATSSLNKLIEMWPEVEGFLPSDLTAPKPMLPALPVDDLNAALRDAGIKVGVIKPAKPAPALAIVPVAA